MISSLVSGRPPRQTTSFPFDLRKKQETKKFKVNKTSKAKFIKKTCYQNFSQMNGNQVDLNLPMKKSGSLSPIPSQDEDDIEIIEKEDQEFVAPAELEMKPSLCKLPSLDQAEERKGRAEETYNKILKEIHGHHYLVEDLKYKLKALESEGGNEHEARKLTQSLGREKLKIESLERKAYLVHKRLIFWNHTLISNYYNLTDIQMPNGEAFRSSQSLKKRRSPPDHWILI